LGGRWFILILVTFKVIVVLFGARVPLIPGIRPIGGKGTKRVLIREFDHSKLLLGE
jgi:hypothetical protein